MRYYSCDSHVVEAREVFDGLEARFGERAPRIEHDWQGRPGDWLLLPGLGPIPVGRLGIAGSRLDDPATDARIARGYEGLNPGVRDPSKRLGEQLQDGICGEVMYPSLNMFTYAIPDAEVANAVFQRHNDWVLDYCSVAPDRLIGIGCLPIPDIDAALAEMKRSATRGVRGFMIPTHVSPEQPYCDPVYDRLWAAAEEFGVPLTMHIFTGVTLDGGHPAHWGSPGGTIKGYTFAHTTAANTVIDLICGGVVERYPGLKFIVSEYETGWLAHFLQRLDHATYRTPRFAVDYLKMKPSEYFRRNFHATFEDDHEGILTRDSIGVDCLLWGNDYPHHDAIWPHSMPTLKRIMEGVPASDIEKMCFANTIDLYKIDVAKLPTESTVAAAGGSRRVKRVCVIEGEDASPEAVRPSVEVLKSFGLPIEWVYPPVGLAAARESHGSYFPDEARAAIDASDTTLFGSTSGPSGGAVTYLRWGKQTFANVRPARWMPGCNSPLKRPEEVDFIIVRENLEDMYVRLEGDLQELAPLELVSPTARKSVTEMGAGRYAIKVITEERTAAVTRFSCELARKRRAEGHAGKVTCGTKHNMLPGSDGYFLEVARRVAKEYEDVTFESYIIDDFARRLIADPGSLDVVVLPNLYGDVLSDAAAGLIGGLGLAPSGCFGDNYAYFESAHGTAPDIAGQHIINPTATLLSGAMMLDYLGFGDATASLRTAIEAVYAEGRTLTPDQGGTASTDAFAEAVLAAIGG